MTIINESDVIPGVFLVTLESYSDARGRFMETFRREWFPQRSWQETQVNRSDSSAGVLRGLHYHHHQVDYWYVMKGRIRAGLVDLRHDSNSFSKSIAVEMGEGAEIGLFIPSGVAHGFLALSDATLCYVVDSYYDGGADEFGVAWDDPDLAIDWRASSPLLSARDSQNPRLKDISPADLPGATR